MTDEKVYCQMLNSVWQWFKKYYHPYISEEDDKKAMNEAYGLVNHYGPKISMMISTMMQYLQEERLEDEKVAKTKGK